MAFAGSGSVGWTSGLVERKNRLRAGQQLGELRCLVSQGVGSNRVASLTADDAAAILARRSLPRSSRIAVRHSGWSRVWDAFSGQLPAVRVVGGQGEMAEAVATSREIVLPVTAPVVGHR